MPPTKQEPDQSRLPHKRSYRRYMLAPISTYACRSCTSHCEGEVDIDIRRTQRALSLLHIMFGSMILSVEFRLDLDSGDGAVMLGTDTDEVHGPNFV
nr:hypothetical protein CFP56_44429 [Quercus suber]